MISMPDFILPAGFKIFPWTDLCKNGGTQLGLGVTAYLALGNLLM